ncbi:Phosphofructokinase [Cynara cardunculus var. scolymus]|uniref:Phosphofructokinase n=1 Tax=Cynara cardunculus var. scolymus TaxID=59895 RepID=A0A118K574_CYNCS|nr:Phosphofructokinase [Cynara cardunculus var. scolymus]
MGSLSPAIHPSLTLQANGYHLVSFPGVFRSVLSSRRTRPDMTAVCERGRCVVYAEKKSNEAIDYCDPEWKSKFKKDFEKRFNIPHISDFFPDAVSYPSTFCLSMRTPVNEEFAEGYPSDEEWYGYINNDDRVLLKVIRYFSPSSAGAECIDPDCTWVEQWIHRAGPREKIYFKPEDVKAAIVTCGGLCPGLNDVIRQIVITLEIYGVKKIVGIPFGYRGFGKEIAEMPLSREIVQNAHLTGGSLLGVSRGGPSVHEIVDSMGDRNINMLFVLGGNGTHAGANAIHKECIKRGLKVAVVGVPKTIDNDILLMDKTFGFDTAVEEAQRAINAAYIEAHSAYRGIGIVPFELHGPHGVLSHLKYLLETKGSAVICVAEGAGQNFLEKTNAKDASGNVVLGDIGVHIQQEVKKYFKDMGDPADVKYIDPTYMIRACRANASDGILCTVLGQNAVHGAFAGYSGITVGICNTHYVYIPITEVISYPKIVDQNSRMWHRCLTSTGQPDFL